MSSRGSMPCSPNGSTPRASWRRWPGAGGRRRRFIACAARASASRCAAKQRPICWNRLRAPVPHRPAEDVAEQARLAEARAGAVERARRARRPGRRRLGRAGGAGETLALSAVDVEPGREGRWPRRSVTGGGGGGRGCCPRYRVAEHARSGRARPPGRACGAGFRRARPLAAGGSAERAARVSCPRRDGGGLRLGSAAPRAVVRRRDRGGIPARARGAGAAPPARGGAHARGARGRRDARRAIARPTPHVTLRAASRRARAHRPRSGARRAAAHRERRFRWRAAASLAAGSETSRRARPSCGGRLTRPRRRSLRSRSSSLGWMPSPRRRGAASARQVRTQQKARARSWRRRSNGSSAAGSSWRRQPVREGGVRP